MEAKAGVGSLGVSVCQVGDRDMKTRGSETDASVLGVQLRKMGVG